MTGIKQQHTDDLYESKALVISHACEPSSCHDDNTHSHMMLDIANG